MPISVSFPRGLAGVLALVSLAAPPSSAAPIHLEDGVAFLEVDPASQDGLTAWTVNGVQHVRTQWFWLGSVAEQVVRRARCVIIVLRMPRV